MTTFTCFDCGKEKQEQTGVTLGYAKLPGGNKVCYACCAERDKVYMHDHEKDPLYLTQNKIGGWEVTDWSGHVAPGRVPHDKGSA